MEHDGHSRRSNSKGEQRTYRQLVRTRLTAARVTVQETDLGVYTDLPPEAPIDDAAKESVIAHRGYLEAYIRQHPQFASAMQPWPEDPLAPAMVQEMIWAAGQAQVGPMAAVAGAMAEHVGKDLLDQAKEVIVENGGDVFMHTGRSLILGVFAGKSPLSLKIGLRIEAGQMPLAVCTSSGTVGHSLSHGKADAACVMSRNCALADAVATAVGNQAANPRQIQTAIEWGRHIPGVEGILIIVGNKMGAWGNIEVVPV